MTKTLTRDFYLSTGSVEVYKSDHVQVYIYGDSTPCAVGFVGKSNKPTFRYAFPSTEQRTSFINTWTNKYDSIMKERKENIIKRREEKKNLIKNFVHSVQVGDIFENTTYMYSNRTTFVQVVGFNKSGKKVQVVELGLSQVDGDWMNGNITCNPDYKGSDINELVVMPYSSTDNTPMLRGRLDHTIRDKETGEVKWVNKGYPNNFYKWSGKPIWNNCD